MTQIATMSRRSQNLIVEIVYVHMIENVPDAAEI